MTTNIPAMPDKAFRIELVLDYPESRMDSILHNALKQQDENITLKNISKTALKSLFSEKKIMIKGQRAKSNSALAKGSTFVDILGF